MYQPVETLNEAGTCREYVTPALKAAGWTAEPHSLVEQYTFTDGRILIYGSKAKRGKPKRADYLLRYRRDFPIAVVEAKAEDKPAAQGTQQAKEYAQILGVSFAYATNGKEIIEYDFLAGTEKPVPAYPSPDELWSRLRAKEGFSDTAAKVLLTPSYHQGSEGSPRYYQEIAVNRALQAILTGKPRVLLTLATGTGKSFIAFQIAWKLWSARWNRTGEHRRPRILFLADRTVLVDDPHDKTFTPLGEARHRVGGKADLSREVYFSTYQGLAGDESREGLFQQFPDDFFDLIIVDEAHRGSARDESNWRGILEHFRPAYQLGLTATPRRSDNVDTYTYFGNPVYTYSLRQGIEDGFLAPYKVFRIKTEWDEFGWRAKAGMVDKFDQPIPEGTYSTRDFERLVSLSARTEAIAKHLTAFLKQTDRFAKTIVFCVDQEHALAMRQALTNLNSDLTKDHPDYVCRVTADEGDDGRAYLSRFQEVDSQTPTILTTSQMLTTGVNAPTCKNVVLVRVVESMVEFKQIIGRGTRVREDYGKLFFNILDYAGSASLRFQDPAFDGDPALITEEDVDREGKVTSRRVEEKVREDAGEYVTTEEGGAADGHDKRRKLYVEGGSVQIVSEIVQELDAEGNVLRTMRLTDYTAEKVRTLAASAEEMGQAWSDRQRREDVLSRLAERGIDFEELAKAVGKTDADPFDVLCHLAFDAPLLTRRERAEQLKRKRRDFFEQYGPSARAILEELLEKYAEHGVEEFKIPDTLLLPPLNQHGKPAEIARIFGGADRLKSAVRQLETLLYKES
jgi:type I restriction enzyme R subunit